MKYFKTTNNYLTHTTINKNQILEIDKLSKNK
jgi:hypothetical protein